MDTGEEILLIGLVAGWSTLALGWWFFGKIRGVWHRKRFGVPPDYNVLQVQYGRRMTHATDRQILGRLFTEEVAGAFQVERAALLLPKAHQLLDVRGGQLRLPVSHAAVRWVTSCGEALRNDN